MKRYFLTVFTVLFSMVLQAQVVANGTKQTCLYAVEDGDSLSLDYYRSTIDNDKKHPCLIFMFGGAFSHGNRGDARYLPFFGFLNEQGIDVVSIDYRLGLKGGVSMTNMGEVAQKIGNAVKMAAEDLLKATAFVLRQAEAWNINPEQIMTCGSSAGAVAVLLCENMLCNNSPTYFGLPEGFNYLGVISMAGALPSLQGAPQWKRAPAPILFFHGNVDSNVPYNTLTLGDAGFYGPKYLVSQLDSLKAPYFFYSVDNGDHALANSPMDVNRDEVMLFIRRMALGGEPLVINTEVKLLGGEKKMAPATLDDYIRSNYR